MFVHTIYIWLLISIYTHIYVHVCVCMCMYCYVWLPSSLLPPSSILTAPFSFQPPSSLLPASIINLVWYIGALIIYLFLYICALAINPVGYIYVCVHWPYIFFDSTSLLCMCTLTIHICICSVFLLLAQLTPRMSTQCALHYTCTLCHVTDLCLLNCIYMITTT